MSQIWPQGTWVQIETVVLSPGQRAPQVPPDTSLLPLVMHVKGFLAQPAAIGDTAEIATVIGRLLSGRVTEANPPARYDFGRPIPELLKVGMELRLRLGEYAYGL